jgi:hypothetical protein
LAIKEAFYPIEVNLTMTPVILSQSNTSNKSVSDVCRETEAFWTLAMADPRFK